MKAGVWVAAAAAAAAACGMVYATGERKKKTEMGKVTAAVQSRNQPEPAAGLPVDACRAELNRYGEKLEGLYGATERLLFGAKNPQKAEDMCFRWESRLDNEEQTPFLWSVWKGAESGESESRLNRWFEFLRTLGVKKCEEKEVTVDSEVLRRYDLPDEEGDFTGKHMRVENPCWMLGDKVLEKGTLL